jgi:small subunit ribosomal protein S5
MADELNNASQDTNADAPPAEGGAPAAPEQAARVETHAAPHEGGRGRGDRRDRGPRRQQRREPGAEGDVEESVVKVYRCATVVKGGRRFSFAALVVCGDRRGKVGVGYGKANEVPSAVEKATKMARRAMVPVQLQGTTIPHQVIGKFGASRVTILPAGEGTGVIAGDSVRVVMELAGVKDVLTKAYGSTSPKNLVKAALDALQRLRSRDQIAKLREVALN